MQVKFPVNEWEQIYLTKSRASVNDFFPAGLPKILCQSPPNESAEVEEINELLWMRDHLRDAQKILIDSEKDAFTSNFTTLLKQQFSSEKAIKIAHFFSDRIVSSADELIMREKARWMRARPYHVEPLINGLYRMGHPSYPSGHTTQARILSLALKDLLPKAGPFFYAKLDELALNIGRRREIGGLHFPSDTRAGWDFGLMAFNEIKQTSFYKELVLDTINRAK